MTINMTTFSRKLDTISTFTLVNFLATLYSMDTLNALYEADERAALQQMACDVLTDNCGTWTPGEVSELYGLVMAAPIEA
jgi:xanthine dehydrogenase iron-sulfur cluster and FAD-binding subunit A